MATNTPLNNPQSIPTTHATKNATITGAANSVGLATPPQSTLSIAEPAMAIVAPTEISCPPDAAVTSVIPIARIASSEP